MDAPAGISLSQLVKLPRVSVRYSHAVGFAVLLGSHFPVMLSTFNSSVSYQQKYIQLQQSAVNYNWVYLTALPS